MVEHCYGLVVHSLLGTIVLVLFCAEIQFSRNQIWAFYLRFVLQIKQICSDLFICLSVCLYVCTYACLFVCL